eukprot:scaffold3929_cov136-Isochrysis_galbana.AAC.4
MKKPPACKLTLQNTKAFDAPQPCIPETIGRAPGGKVKGGGGKGGKASLPGDSRVSSVQLRISGALSASALGLSPTVTELKGLRWREGPSALSSPGVRSLALVIEYLNDGPLVVPEAEDIERARVQVGLARRPHPRRVGPNIEHGRARGGPAATPVGVADVHSHVLPSRKLLRAQKGDVAVQNRSWLLHHRRNRPAPTLRIAPEDARRAAKFRRNRLDGRVAAPLAQRLEPVAAVREYRVGARLGKGAPGVGPRRDRPCGLHVGAPVARRGGGDVDCAVDVTAYGGNLHAVVQHV